MSTALQAQYNAESRTVTPGRNAVVTTQSWKKAAPAAAAPGPSADPRLIAQEARTAAPSIHTSRPLDEALLPGAHSRQRGGETVEPNSFASALAMSGSAGAAPAATPSSSFSFDDFIDIVNPLQHIPIVNLAYRELTGDRIGPVAQIIGGGIFGGPVGAVSGTVNAVVQGTTGKDVAGNVLALVSGDDGVWSVADNQPNPDAAPDAIDRDNPEMALSMASAQYTGEQYLPAMAASAPATPVENPRARYAANAYQRNAALDAANIAPASGIDALPAIEVDYITQSLDAMKRSQNDTIIAMPATPVFGGLY